MRSPRTHVALAFVTTCLIATEGAAQLAVVRQGRESRASQEFGESFGFALAVGDFDGDGYDDVASGTPYEAIGSAEEESGAVIISFGGPYGLGWERSEILLATNQFFVPETDQAWFGYALAAGDFDDDGFDDLIVGAPLLDWNGVTDTGAIYMYLGGGGTSGGLEGQTPIVFDQSFFGAAVEQGDFFGGTLWAGALDDDSFDDLLIGGTGENQATGAIYGAYGSPNTLVADIDLTISASEAGAAAQVNDAFGTRVIAADVTGGPEADLIVGVPFEDFGSFFDAGAVYVIPMDGGSPQLSETFCLEPNDWGLPRQQAGWFGMGLAAGDFESDFDDTLDLAVGAPGEDNGQGKVYVMNGDAGGQPSYVDVFGQSKANDFTPPTTEGETAEAGDHFGWSLVTLDHDADGRDDLAVGSPGETINDFDGDPHSDTGLVTILYAHPAGVGGSLTDDIYTEFDLGTRQLGNARTGEVLAAGDNDDDPGENLFVGAPGWNANTGQYYDIAPWRQVYQLTTNSAIAAGCADVVYYALRPFDEERTASTGKIMTVLLACEAALLPPGDPDRVPLSTEYTMPQWLDDAFNVTGCSAFNFALGEVVTFETLLRLTMMISANDATYAIADLVADDITEWIDSEATVPDFVALMNARAAEIGMTDTTFGNPSGIDTPNQWTTTYDMYLLLKEAMRNPLFEDIAGTLQYAWDRQIPASGGGFELLDTITSYTWLSNVQSFAPLAIAGKPGSTSVFTRAAAGRQPNSPWGMTYGLAYGIPKSQGGGSAWGLGNAHVAALVNLGLALCDPEISVDDFPTVPDLTPPHTMDDVDLDFPGDQTLFCVEMTDRPVGLLDDPLLDDLVLEFDFNGDNGVKVETEIVSLSLTSPPPAFDTTWGVQRYESHEGIRVANPDPVKFLPLTIEVSHPPMIWDAVLPPLGEFLVPPDATGDGVGAFEIRVRNDDTIARDIQVDPTWSFAKTMSPSDPALLMTVVSDPAATRFSLCVLVEATSDPSVIEEVALTIKEPADPYQWQACEAEARVYGSGWPGELGVPPLSVDHPPALGEIVTLQIGSSSLAALNGYLLLGPNGTDLPTEFDGRQLVEIDALIPVVLPPAGVDVPIGVPFSPAFCGLRFYWQLVLLDPQASGGVSFSRGLELEIGG